MRGGVDEAAALLEASQATSTSTLAFGRACHREMTLLDHKECLLFQRNSVAVAVVVVAPPSRLLVIRVVRRVARVRGIAVRVPSPSSTASSS